MKQYDIVQRLKFCFEIMLMTIGLLLKEVLAITFLKGLMPEMRAEHILHKLIKLRLIIKLRNNVLGSSHEL